MHLHDAREEEPREDRAAARVWGRGRGHPNRGPAGLAGVVLPGRGPPHRGDPWGLPAEPVLQPGEPASPLSDHRAGDLGADRGSDRKSTRLNSSHLVISYAVFCLKKKTTHYAAHVAGKDRERSIRRPL